MTGPAYAELVAALRLEGAAIAAAAAQVDLDAPVAACPDWTVADLVAHVAGVYERTATLVARRATGPVDVDAPTGLAGDALVKALETALDELVEVLAEADAETPVYNWSGANQHARFWARRMVHESTVHRYDVQRALSVAEPVPGDLAVDGVDELVDVVAPRVLARDAVTLPEATMSLLGADAGAWHLRLGPAGVERLDVLASPDVTVAGTASALLLAAYGRVPWTSLQLTGDVGVLDAWSAAVRF